MKKKRRKMIEEVWLIKAVRTETLQEPKEHVLSEYDTITSFIRKNLCGRRENSKRQENEKNKFIY